MVDNITLKADIGYNYQNEGRKNIHYGKLTFTPVISPVLQTVEKYIAQVDNLRFTIRSGYLFVENSLHTFYNGNNYCDFSFSDLVAAIEFIEDLTGIDAEKFEVVKLEFAINITTKESPINYIKLFSHLNGKPYASMTLKNGLQYGVRYEFTEFQIKVYDKKRQAKDRFRTQVNDNIMRFEIVYKKSRRLPVFTYLSDLKEKKRLFLFYEELLKYIKQIIITGKEDFSNLSSRNREMYFAGINSRLWDTEAAINKETKKKKKQRFKSILLSIPKHEVKEEFIAKIESKFKQLTTINSSL